MTQDGSQFKLHEMLHRQKFAKRLKSSPGYFFDQLKDSDDAERFTSLRVTLERLSEMTIFRVGDGEVTVDIFLIGKNRHGEWIGLHTQSVET